MKKKVLKFGGTSVGSIERIVHASKIIKRESDSGNKLIVVVSAMAGKTNELISMSKSVSNNFSKRELDVLLSTGEQVSCALLSGALNEIGIKAKSFMNWQIPILTEGENNNARIINMSVDKINEYLSIGGVAVIPGYQGVSSLGEVTTIGRGGSDASAIMIAKFFKAETRERFWLTLTTDSGAYNQILLGLLNEATDGWDHYYDGVKLKGNPHLAFYSMYSAEECVIQGLSKDLSQEKLIPLGVDAWKKGQYTIALDSLNNWQNANYIYLLDSSQGITVDMKATDYTFTVNQTGVIKGRFYIKVVSFDTI